MLGRGPMFRQMDEDAFFAEHREQMRRMDNMFGGDPFRGFGFGMLQDGQSHGQDRGRERGGAAGNQQLAPFGDFGFGNMFGNMSQMMQNMSNQAGQMSAGQMSGNNGQCYQQSSFMSYSNTGEGAPKVFQATTSSRTGPGGVRETRKAVRDTERDLEKMAIGRHIHDRGHEMEKHKNTRSGHVEERQNFHNIDEREAESFNHEWQGKANAAFRDHDRRELRDRHYERRRHDDRGRDRPLALPQPGDEHKQSHGGRKGDRRRDRS